MSLRWMSTFVMAALFAGCTPPPRAAITASECAAVSDDAELAALYTRPVRDVTPIHKYRAATDHHDLQGAAIRVSAPSVDHGELERALACHAAGHSVRPLSAASASSDPLRPSRGGASVLVEREGADLVVKVTSPDDRVAEEILESARRLPRGG